MFDIRNIKNEISNINFDGGLWRSIWNPNNINNIVLAVYTSYQYEFVKYDNQYTCQNLDPIYNNH